MANAYLVSKWKIWYKSLDVNHDGKISKADVEESRNKFSELHELNDEKKALISENFDKWWNLFIFGGNLDAEISEEEFVGKLNKEFSADKAKFVAKISDCFDMFFDVIDTNKDRSISEEEFLYAFKAYGHENVALDKSFFQAYGPKGGLVPLKDIVASWINFATSEDASKDDVVKKGFDSGV
ncbi:hypothetical protein ACF0H5_018921 [Mactra antiquata]